MEIHIFKHYYGARPLCKTSTRFDYSNICGARKETSSNWTDTIREFKLENNYLLWSKFLWEKCLWYFFGRILFQNHRTRKNLYHMYTVLSLVKPTLVKEQESEWLWR